MEDFLKFCEDISVDAEWFIDYIIESFETREDINMEVSLERLKEIKEELANIDPVEDEEFSDEGEDSYERAIRHYGDMGLQTFEQFITEDGDGGGGDASGGGTAYANAANVSGMGDVVSAQPGSTPGATIGDGAGTTGSGDIGKGLFSPFEKKPVGKKRNNHPVNRDKSKKAQNQRKLQDMKKQLSKVTKPYVVNKDNSLGGANKSRVFSFDQFKNNDVFEGKEVSNKEIFDDFVAKGDDPKEAAEKLLDILTNGMWTIWDQDKIDEYIEKIVNKFT